MKEPCRRPAYDTSIPFNLYAVNFEFLLYGTTMSSKRILIERARSDDFSIEDRALFQGPSLE